MDGLTAIAKFIQDYGWLGVLILIVAGGMFQVYVFRWQYKEKVESEKFWRDLYLANSDKVDRALSTLADAVTLLKERDRDRRN